MLKSVDAIVECVPNFSEGKRDWVINEIIEAIRRIPEVYLLDVHVGKSVNRTVVTFVSSPENIGDAAFEAIKKAAELIDMRKHKGEHPRIGATDVCPFVPIKGVSMEECVKIAREVGKRVGEELEIPVYLYEYAATADYRRHLEDIRAGGYEYLPRKLKDPMWKPDYGPCEWNEKVSRTGATIIGARDLLIAFNVNLNTKDRKIAEEVARHVRRRCVIEKLPGGTVLKEPLKTVKAIGWYIEEYGTAQVSMNIVNYKAMPLWKVFEICIEESEKFGVRVVGSEIIGLIPKEAILEVGRYYLRKQGKSDAVPEGDLIHVAAISLGLGEAAGPKLREKILEYKMEEVLGERRIVNMTLREFIDELSRSTPVPGGGGVAALLGSLSASLSSMVSALTYGKKGYEKYNEDIIKLGRKAQELKDKCLDLIEEDAKAFNEFMSAYRLPKRTDEEKMLREKKIQEAAKNAIEVPMSVLKLSRELMSVTEELVDKGNRNAISDVGMAVLCACGAAYGAYLNILTNLAWAGDGNLTSSIKETARKIIDEIDAESKRLLSKVIKLIESSG
ncbi:MAG: glutamate formimidoyltransferase [Candidatus Bathyarchaeia archaeon]